MNKNYTICGLIILSASIGMSAGAVLFSTNTITEKVIEIDNNPDLELRLQSEIDSNQEMFELIIDVINYCNTKLLDKQNMTNEKLENEGNYIKILPKHNET